MMKLHHIGIATTNIAEEIENVRKFQDILSVSDIIFDRDQNASLCIVKIRNGLDVELISGKPVENLLAKGITYYHLCYETAELEEELLQLTNKGAVLISAPKPAVLFNNRKVAFVYLPYGVLELLEGPESPT